MSKVKGHATSQDVRRGLVSARDKHGNDSAEGFACAASVENALPECVVQEVLHRKSVVRDDDRDFGCQIKAPCYG